MKQVIAYFLILLFLLSNSSCSLFKFGDEDKPVSINSPIANLTSVFHSAPGSDGNVRVTGLEGAVSALSVVTAKNTNSQKIETTTADSMGAFQLEITASIGDVITLTVSNGSSSDSLDFTVSALDPLPLNVEQTDVAVSSALGAAFVTVTGSETSLIKIDLNLRSISNSYVLTDPQSGAPLQDLVAIEAFETTGMALILDRTQLKFYLVDLQTAVVKENPIAITGNYATIVKQNPVSFRVRFDGVTESEELIRTAVASMLQAFNSRVTVIPDSGTSVFLDGKINPTTTQFLLAATLSGNGRLIRLEFQNNDLTVNAEVTADFADATLSGLEIFNENSRIILGNQAVLSNTNDQRVLYVCDLLTLQITDTVLIDGKPEEILLNSNSNKIFVTLSSLHQLVEIDATSLSLIQSLPTGPIPSRFTLAAQGDLSLILNSGDTTVSFIEF